MTFLVQAQQPTLSEVTFQGSDLAFIIIEQLETSETGPPTTEQDTIVNTCELCAFNDETVLCAGLTPSGELQSACARPQHLQCHLHHLKFPRKPNFSP